jgi:hypothetical protein
MHYTDLADAILPRLGLAGKISPKDVNTFLHDDPLRRLYHYLALADLSSVIAAPAGEEPVTSPDGFVAGIPLAIFAYKGLTTITNSGGRS